MRLVDWPIGSLFQVQYGRQMGIKLADDPQDPDSPSHQAYLFDTETLVTISNRANKPGINLHGNTEVGPVTLEIHQAVGVLSDDRIVLYSPLPGGHECAVTEVVPIRNMTVPADQITPLTGQQQARVALIRDEATIMLKETQDAIEKAGILLKAARLLVEEQA